MHTPSIQMNSSGEEICRACELTVGTQSSLYRSVLEAPLRSRGHCEATSGDTHPALVSLWSNGRKRLKGLVRDGQCCYGLFVCACVCTQWGFGATSLKGENGDITTATE